MSREELLAALLAERYGPLPVERTRPIPKVIPKPQPPAFTRVVFVNDSDRAPWRSRANYVDAEWDWRAA